MRIYRHQYSGKRFSKVWYVSYKDHTGKRRRVPGYVDKRATEQLGAELERKTARILAGLDEPDRDDKSAVSELIDEWESAMRGRGLGDSHATQYSRAVRVVAKGCKFGSLRMVDGHKAQAFLERRAKSNRTYQWYRAALNAFGNWLHKKRKLAPSNPFSIIDSRNPEIGVKRLRRSLSESEFRRFL